MTEQTTDYGGLWQITAPHFCAGFATDRAGVVLAAAPIIAWARGKGLDYLNRYLTGKRWKLERVSRDPR